MQRPNADTTRRRRLAWLVATPLLVMALYLVVANGLINARLTQTWLTDKTGMSIHWASGWSGFPGQLTLEGLHIEGDEPALQLAMERSHLRLSLPAFLQRRLAISRFTADGVSRVGLDDLRLEGNGDVALSHLTVEDGRVSIQGLSLDMEDALVRRDHTVLADDIRLATDLQVAPFSLHEPPDLAAIRFVSGSLSLEATADAWDVFNPYLLQLGWLELAGHGQLSGELSLEQGALAPGSDLSLDSPSLRVTLDDSTLLSSAASPGNEGHPERGRTTAMSDRHHLGGAGRITGRVVEGDGGPVMELGVTLDEMAMQKAGLVRPFMTSRRFQLSTRVRGTDLADSRRELISARLEWEDARLPDVGALAPYLPEGGPLSLQGGSARLKGYLAYRDGLLDGHFRLVGDRIALRLTGRAVEGRMALDLAMPRIDPHQGLLDLTGTHLEVAARGEGDELPLTTALTLEEARLTSTAPLEALIHAKGPPSVNGRVVMTGRVARLDVLDSFFTDTYADGLLLQGGGELSASLELTQGRVAAGSRLAVTTESLQARLLTLEAGGRGSVTASWYETPNGPRARLNARLEEARVSRSADDVLLMQDGRLVLTAESDMLDDRALLANSRLSLSWQDASMPDIAVLQPYLPAAVPGTLKSGRATTHGRIDVENGLAHGEISLTGTGIVGRLFEREVEGALTLDLAMREADLGTGRLDLSGSRLTMQAATTASEQRLQTRIVAREARLGPLLVPERDDQSPGRDGTLVLDGMIANLTFLDDFLPSAHGLTLAGNGRFSARLHVSNNQLEPGSRFMVEADDLAVGFLEFTAKGRGRLEAGIDGEESAPGARLRLTLPRFSLHRDDEAHAYVEGRHFRLDTETTRFRLDEGAPSLEDVTTRVQLPIAEVDDLSRYNAYLPEGSGVALLGGRAGLEVDLHLEGRRARGDLVLQAFDTSLRFGEQYLDGDLRLEARLRDGDLVSRQFDASGSQLRLANIQRRDEQTLGEAGWWARLGIIEGKLDWSRPLQLDAQLEMAMRDSGLLTRLFLANAREWAWLGRRLTVNDIRGDARLQLNDDTLQVRNARLTGGPLEMRANLSFHDGVPDGSLYARLGILAAGVSLEKGQPDVRLLRPRHWFERNRSAPAEDLEEVTARQWQEALDALPTPSARPE